MDYSQGVPAAPCSPFFDQLRKQLGPFLVDKTQLIEKIVNNGLNGRVHLVLRPRRCGKTTMLQMLKSFFCMSRIDPHQLFDGLDIAEHLDICREHMGKYAVLFLDFKNITGESWEAMFASFKTLVSKLYREWREYLWDSLTTKHQAFFESILQKTASEDDWKHSLTELSCFLAQQSKRRVMVFIDEYEAPNNRAYEHDFSKTANTFFGRDVLPALLKTNSDLEYAILAGVTPTAKTGWYSGLNNIEKHPLHAHSIFAGMLMFTEEEVMTLRTLLKSKLDPADLKAHYNSYLAAGVISVYNPVSIMSAFARSEIENFWVETGEYPLLRRNIPEDFSQLDIIERLLTGADIELGLRDSVTFSKCGHFLTPSILTLGQSSPTLDMAETLTLLYYAGYLTTTTNGKYKIPNREVMADWATWITSSVNVTDILDVCANGPVNTFAEDWPQFMQQNLDPKIVAKTRGAVSRKTPERIYHVYLFGLLHALRSKSWEVTIEPRAGSGFIDIHLVSKKLRSAVLIELKSSENKQDINRDSLTALDQIVQNNYRNRVGLPNVCTLREYGIANHHLESCVNGRYLELDARSARWVEKADPAMAI